MPNAKDIADRLSARPDGVITRLAVFKATGEIAEKSMTDIETETGLTWGARALAAWENAVAAREEGDEVTFLSELSRALTFKNEALEHGAMGREDIYHELRVELGAIPY